MQAIDLSSIIHFIIGYAATRSQLLICRADMSWKIYSKASKYIEAFYNWMRIRVALRSLSLVEFGARNLEDAVERATWGRKRNRSRFRFSLRT